MRHPRERRMVGPARAAWSWARPAVGVAILAVLVWKLGTRPFLEAVRGVDVWPLAAAAGIAVVTTVCCAWRWRLVSRGLGSDVPLRGAVAAYYRSQFLNTVLPGGVLGDVHRAVRRGRDVGDVRHAVRVVVWERAAGQVVQIVLTVVLLLVLPSPLRSSMPAVALALGTAALSVVLLGRALPRSPGLLRVAGPILTDLRGGLLARRVWPGVALASGLVVAGHAATFLVAARAAGSTASVLHLLPLGLFVLLATALPTNIAGWGPREGAAAWVFASAGLGAAQGVAVAVTYGVMALVATLPGAAVLLAGRRRPRSEATQLLAAAPPSPEPLPSGSVAMEGGPRV